MNQWNKNQVKWLMVKKFPENKNLNYSTYTFLFSSNLVPSHFHVYVFLGFFSSYGDGGEHVQS